MSYSAMRPDGVAVRPAIYANTNERLDYIRKVYSLMLAGLVVFALSMALPLWGYASKTPILGDIANLAITAGMSTMGFLVTFAILIGSSYFAHSISMVRGLNLVGFFLLAVVWGFITMPLVAFAMIKATGTIELTVPALAPVFQALGLTSLVFGGLTAYVFITKQDFSFMRGFLMMGLILAFVAIGGGIVMSLLGYDVHFLNIAISAFLVLLFSGYVLYDTSNILHHYATDMIVPGALALMVDFIILFRSILFLLMSRD